MVATGRVMLTVLRMDNLFPVLLNDLVLLPESKNSQSSLLRAAFVATQGTTRRGAEPVHDGLEVEFQVEISGFSRVFVNNPVSLHQIDNSQSTLSRGSRTTTEGSHNRPAAPIPDAQTPVNKAEGEAKVAKYATKRPQIVKYQDVPEYASPVFLKKMRPDNPECPW